MRINEVLRKIHRDIFCLGPRVKGKENKELGPLLTNDSIIVENIGNGCFKIEYESQCWQLSTTRKNWQEIIDGKICGDPFYGDVAAFFKQNIICDPEIPKNHRKIWLKSEKDQLFTLLLNGFSTIQIAQKLERKPSAVIYQVGQQLNQDLEKNLYRQDCWDIPLIELTLVKSNFRSKKDSVREYSNRNL